MGNNVIAELLADNLETFMNTVVPPPSQEIHIRVPQPSLALLIFCLLGIMP